MLRNALNIWKNYTHVEEEEEEDVAHPSFLLLDMNPGSLSYGSLRHR